MIPSINLATVPQLDFSEALQASADAGFEGVGVWFDPVRQHGISKTRKALDSLGLRVTSLCPSGSFGDHGEDGFDSAVDHTKAAIDMAADLQADCLCILPGSYPRDRTDLALAREFARRGFDTVVPYAKNKGVTLAIEPLHPMYTDGYSVVNTVAEALEWAMEYDVSLFIDTYHVWWDPTLETCLEKAKGRVAGFHVNDWRRPTEDLVADRAVPGQGIIDLERIFRAVRGTGYDGAAEIEIFSKRLAQESADQLLSQCRESLRPFGI